MNKLKLINYLVILLLIFILLNINKNLKCNKNKKYILHDGKNKVNSINVYGIFKNNEFYLKYLLLKLSIMEQIYDVEFRYYFYENNSIDKTKKYLKDFFKNRKGKLYSVDFINDNNTRIERSNVKINFIKNLIKYRNFNLNMSRPITSDWNIIIDSDIYFDTDCLKHFFNIKPKLNNIGMMTPYTVDNNKWHYYDTYAFKDSDNEFVYPKCLFERCTKCKNKKIKINDEIIKVNSSFGGFAVIDSEILRNDKILWNISNKDQMCEHIGFCKNIKKYTNKKIVVCQNIIMFNVENKL